MKEKSNSQSGAEQPGHAASTSQNQASSGPLSPSQNQASIGPLKGLKVLDLTRLLPGPLAAMMMADMGAEVVKIEHPREPDYIRSFPPFRHGLSLYYQALNRSKLSLALDTRHPRGKEIFFQLVEQADVLMESFRPGVLEAAGMGYPQLKAINPGLIYASVTGFGQDGPYAQMAGHDLNYLSLTGMLSLMPDANGFPVFPGFQIADVAGGSYPALAGVLAALWQRERSGTGQHVDIAMTDAVRVLASLAVAEESSFSNPESLVGSAPLLMNGKPLLAGGMAIYGVYACADGGYMALAALEPKFWKRFCEAAGVPDWMGRMLPDAAVQTELRRDLEQLFLTHNRDYWTELGQRSDCCLSPVLSMRESAKDPHLLYRSMVGCPDDAAKSKTEGSPLPLHFDQTAAWPGGPAPDLGQHTQIILDQLGISAEQQAELRQAGVIR